MNTIENRQAEGNGEEPWHWFVVQTNGHQERLALSALKAEGIETYMPLFLKQNRKGDVYAAPLFPSFLFVRLRRGDAGWRAVFSTRGVRCVLGAMNHFSVVADREILDIKSRERDGFIHLGVDSEASSQIAPGTAVSVRKGRLGTLDAVFLEMLDKNRCSLLVKMLGQELKATVQLAHIEVRSGADAIQQPAKPRPSHARTVAAHAAQAA
jgi:transcription antitermination factor NusG